MGFILCPQRQSRYHWLFVCQIQKGFKAYLYIIYYKVCFVCAGWEV